VGVLERVACMAAAEAVAVDNCVSGGDVNFEGDSGVLADLGGADPCGRRVIHRRRCTAFNSCHSSAACSRVQRVWGLELELALVQGPSPSAVDGIVLGSC
jgi:hypothetical protein